MSPASAQLIRQLPSRLAKYGQVTQDGFLTQAIREEPSQIDPFDRCHRLLPGGDHVREVEVLLPAGHTGTTSRKMEARI